MKTKIAILTDSSTSIYNAKHDHKNIFMINIPCFLGDEIFTDFAKNGNEVFYKALKNSNVVPKTSQPSVGETVDMYESIKVLGFTHIIYMPISKELSGTYHNAHLARDMVEDIDITIVDTLSAVSILASMVIEAARLAEENKTVAEILTVVESMKTKWNYYLTVNDLTPLIKNGRLSNAKGFVANLLKIKPVIKFSQDGKLNAIENIRTYKSALKAVVEKVLQEINQDSCEVHISYTENKEDMEFVKELLLSKLPSLKILVYTLTPTIVAHLGLQAVGIGYINY